MMNEQALEDTMIEVKEDHMISPAGDSAPTLRIAHFLKPIANSIHEQAFEFKQSSPPSSVSEPKEWPLKINFTGWRCPRAKWVRWVDQLKLKYETVWKKVGIFEAIMGTRCRINKNYDLLYRVVEKWCCDTNTFVFAFGEATITLEDIIVLGGYPIIGHPVFTEVKDQEMREVEKKLNIARKQLNSKHGGVANTPTWMDIFIDKGSEIEHEAFLAAWLSIFVFPHKELVKSSLFSIAVHLARGNPIALAPAVLASMYKDLTLYKKTIVGLSKYYVGGDRFPLEVNLRSPFYLVQIWVWERFTNLQPQPKLINSEDHSLLKWHKVMPLKIDNVRLALDSAIDDFLWRPYVRYPNKCGMFYPNNEIWVPFKKDLDTKMLSFVICSRVAELVGFESIEQYLPHRVAMQFGIDQDVPSYVARFNETKYIAWENYCRPISYKNLYFPPRLFEADVTMRYAKWWKQLVLGHGDFVKNIVKRKRSASSRKPRAHVGKASKSGIDFSVPPGFPPNLVDTLIFGKFCDDVPAENSSHDCVKSKNLINQCSSASLADYEDFEKILPLKRPILEENVELSQGALEDDFEDANGRKEARKSSDRAFLSETQGESHSYTFKNKVTVVQHSDMAEGAKEIVEERKERDDEVVILLKEQSLKNQEELARLARQQEEILRLMDLRERRDEELRQLLTSVLRNQQPPSS